MSTHNRRPLFDPPIVRRALVDAFVKLDPRRQLRNPVMFTVFVGSVAHDAALVSSGCCAGGERIALVRRRRVSLWLWFTVLFANFAEAMAEGRGKAQADALKATRQNVAAKKLLRRTSANRTIALDFQVPGEERRGDVCSRARSAAWTTSSSSKPATRFPATAK